MRSLGAAITAGITVLTTTPALADPGGDTDVNTLSGGIGVHVTDSFDQESAGESTGTPALAEQVLEDLTNVMCIGSGLGSPVAPDCDGTPVEPQVTSGIVASAFARIPLPPSQLIVQPPNGRTLVNFDTNFYTETEPFMRSVTLLGQRVELQISPVSFAWKFGDGESRSTSSPGSAYPDLEITHRYLRKGRVSPSVDTTYTATYRVNGGLSQPVPGSVTMPGESVMLRVVTASPQLVG